MSQYKAESSRLRLEPLNESHTQAFYEIQSSPQTMAWSTKPLHTSISQTLQMIQNSRPTPEAPWNRRWAIMLKSSVHSTSQTPSEAGDSGEVKAKLIGTIGTPRKAEVGYKLHPEYWGKGYMSEALEMFLEMWWGMEENNDLMTLEAGADPENVGSMRVLEKAGFKKGELRKGFYKRAADETGKMRDLQWYYLDRRVR